jgi:hypothetical protein
MISLIKGKAQTQQSQIVGILSQDCQLGMKIYKKNKTKHKANMKHCHLLFKNYRCFLSHPILESFAI